MFRFEINRARANTNMEVCGHIWAVFSYTLIISLTQTGGNVINDDLDEAYTLALKDGRGMCVAIAFLL